LSHDPALVEALQQMLSLEERSLPSLAEHAHTYTRCPALAEVFARMAREELVHRRRLAEALLRAGGTLRAGAPDPRVSGLHYLDLAHLAPRVVVEKRRLIERCRHIAERVPGVRALAADICASHESHLAALAELQCDAVA
jgi:hypothetical protein